MEKELRKSENLRGTEKVLGNGETWTIPPLPLNDDGERVAELYDAVATADVETNKEAMRNFFAVMFEHLKLNYPELTEDAAKEAALFTVSDFADFAQAQLGTEAKKA